METLKRILGIDTNYDGLTPTVRDKDCFFTPMEMAWFLEGEKASAQMDHQLALY